MGCWLEVEMEQKWRRISFYASCACLSIEVLCRVHLFATPEERIDRQDKRPGAVFSLTAPIAFFLFFRSLEEDDRREEGRDDFFKQRSITWQKEHLALLDGDIPERAIVDDFQQHVSLVLEEPFL